MSVKGQELSPMDLDGIRARLLTTIRTAQSRSLYRALRGKHPAFSPYPNAEVLVRRLSSDTSNPQEKSLLVARLIDASQNSTEPLWTAILLLAYFPNFYRIRSRLRHELYTADELDALIVECFIEETSSASPPEDGGCAALSLALNTRRNVHRHLLKKSQRLIKETERMWANATLIELEDTPPTPEELFLAQEHRQTRASMWEGLAIAYTTSGGSTDDLELLMSTTGHECSLIEWLRERHPEFDADAFARLYERIRKRRSRLVKKLRKHLTDA